MPVCLLLLYASLPMFSCLSVSVLSPVCDLERLQSPGFIQLEISHVQ